MRPEGIYVPIVTPFGVDGRVDAAALDALADRLLEEGVAGLVALGTTGEPATLSAAERREVIAVCGEACARHGRPLIVGVDGNDTRAVCEDVAALRDGDAVLVVVPHYTRPSQRGIVEHFLRVADASTLPVLVYNIPARTGVRLQAPGLLELAAHPRIAGAKQSTGDLDEDTLTLLAERPDGFGVLGGDDAMLFSLLCAGASGGITASANCAPARFVEMCSLALAGELTACRRVARSLLPAARALFAEPSPAVTKAVLHAQGVLPTPDVRLPMTTASPGATAAAIAALTRMDDRGR